MRGLYLVATLALVAGPLSGALAQDSYPSDLAGKFLSWCTTAQGQPQTVCSCALEKAAQQIPAVAMGAYLAAPEGAATAAMSGGVGASALQIVSSCATAGVTTPTVPTGVESLGNKLMR